MKKHSVRRGYNALGAAHSNQRGVPEGKKRCTRCKHIRLLADFYAGRGFRGRRSVCKRCMNDRKGRRVRVYEKTGPPPPDEWVNPYAILFDPTGTFLGLIRGRDFKETLRWGYWPDGLMVEHDRKLYQVRGKELHATHEWPAKIRRN